MVDLATQALQIRLLLSDSNLGITLQTMLPCCFLTVAISISPWLSSGTDSQALLYGQDGQPRLLPQRQVPQQFFSHPAFRAVRRDVNTKRLSLYLFFLIQGQRTFVSLQGLPALEGVNSFSQFCIICGLAQNSFSPASKTFMKVLKSRGTENPHAPRSVILVRHVPSVFSGVLPVRGQTVY